MSPLHTYLSGVVAALCVISAAFFIRFHRQSKDGLFLLFGGAFIVMALNWTALSFLPAEHEARPYVYSVRLLSFLFIIAGIIYKNRRAP